MSVCDIRSKSGQWRAARQCVILEVRLVSGVQHMAVYDIRRVVSGVQEICVRLKVRVVRGVKHMSVFGIRGEIGQWRPGS